MFVAKQVAYLVRKNNVTFAPTAVDKCSTFRNYFASVFDVWHILSPTNIINPNLRFLC